MQKRSSNINLVASRKGGMFDRFINWALSIGRLVVILVELIALLAFGYRFVLDRELIDLHSKIKAEAKQISFQKADEDAYRNLQSRLKVATDYIYGSDKKVRIFNHILGLAPQGMSFNDFSLNESELSVNATVESVSALSMFVNNLKNYPEIDSVSINRIGNKPSSAIIVVSITATLKK
jgi:hypothetical protein